MLASPKALWDNCLTLIRQHVSEQHFNTWFKPIVFESYKPATKTLLVRVPSTFFYEYLEANFVGLLSKVLHQNFGEGIRLTYRVVVVKDAPGGTTPLPLDPDDANDLSPKGHQAQAGSETAAAGESQMDDIDTQLDPKLTFNNYMEGESNKLPRSVGLSIAEHPNTSQFNPMFIYGPSGSGKTHLVNAIGVDIEWKRRFQPVDDFRPFFELLYLVDEKVVAMGRLRDMLFDVRIERLCLFQRKPGNLLIADVDDVIFWDALSEQVLLQHLKQRGLS